MAGEKQTRKLPLSVRQLMTDSASGFGRILKRARALSELDQRVAGLLDDDLRQNCRVANVRDGRLIFGCNSPGSATRLRMLSARLLEDLHAAGLDEIQSIEVKMMVPNVNRRR